MLNLVQKPVTRTFPLVSLGELPEGTPEPTVTIRQARQGDFDTINRMRSKGQRWNSSTGTQWVDVSIADIVNQMVYLTLSGVSNVENNPFVFKDGRLDMTYDEFYKIWSDLLPAVAQEIKDCMWIVNPDWDDFR